MTNRDFIRNMTNEELAVFLFLISYDEIKISVCENECDECKYSDDYCISQIGEWLQKGVEE